MKKFIVGLVIGLMFTNTFAFASQGISAAFGNFNFVINGQAKTLETQPIVYNGTSYLPVRELSTMLGYEVDYQAGTNTIVLTTSSQPNLSVDMTNTTSDVDVSNLISARNLLDQYDVTINPPNISKGDSREPSILTYKGTSIKTYDYIVVDAKLYFNKSILMQLGIN